MTFSDGMG